MATFLNELEPGALVYDIGCGNGKYHGVNPLLCMVGCDTSVHLLEICASRGMDTVAAEALALPFRQNSADACISIAVIHHLASDTRRLEALKRIVELLKVGGRALIYVWAFEQKLKDGKTTNYVKDSREEKKDELSRELEHLSVESEMPVHCNRTKFEEQDVLVPWKIKSANSSDQAKTLLRYYHVFKEGELDALVSQITNVSLIKSYFDQGNWCAVLEKLAFK